MEHDMKLEKALEELEKIVEALESGELGIEDALKRYEDGVKLSRLCTKKLAETEKKIEMLNRTLNQAADIESADGEDVGTVKAEKKKTKKSSRGSDSDSESGFLL